jgi:hypothetical protein
MYETRNKEIAMAKKELLLFFAAALAVAVVPSTAYAVCCPPYLSLSEEEGPGNCYLMSQFPDCSIGFYRCTHTTQTVIYHCGAT